MRGKICTETPHWDPEFREVFEAAESSPSVEDSFSVVWGERGRLVHLRDRLPHYWELREELEATNSAIFSELIPLPV